MIISGLDGWKTCDQCQYYNICTGWCNKHDVLRHSCGEDACKDFILADDLQEYLDQEPCSMDATILKKTLGDIL